jgi:hypothetical protein
MKFLVLNRSAMREAPIVMPVSDAKTNYWVVWAKPAQVHSLRRYKGVNFKAANCKGEAKPFSVVCWADRITFDTEVRAKNEQDAARWRLSDLLVARLGICHHCSTQSVTAHTLISIFSCIADMSADDNSCPVVIIYKLVNNSLVKN